MFVELMRNQKSKLIILLLVAVVQCLIAIPAWGQGSSKIKGKVVDVMGAAIAKATVTITSSSRRSQVVTNEDGEFEISLPAGTYEIRTEEMPGFPASKYGKVRVGHDKERRLSIKVMHSLKGAWCVLKVTAN